MNNIFNFKKNIDKSKLEICANCIKNGGIVIFPTETVYGIGANALDDKAVSKIFIAKGRPSDNPLIVHICDFDMLKQCIDVSKISKLEEKLIKAFCPGPFTIILPRSKNIPDNVTAGLDTVGIRMPDNKTANLLIKQSGVPIAAPSANISGKPSGTCIEDIAEELANRVDYVIDGGQTNIGIESSVVKVIDDKVQILRPGKISIEDIEKVVGQGNVILNSKIFERPDENEKVESPGMKHRHYAPKCKCILVNGENEIKQIESVKKLITKNADKYNKICVMGFSEHENKIRQNNNIIYLSMGSINNYDEISKNIFLLLRKTDKINCDFCIIEAVKKQGIGIGIMNRLLRACEYNEINA